MDEHQSSSPAAHAGFWILRIIIWHDGVDTDPPGKALLGLRYYLDRLFDLRPGWHECGTIGEGPSVVLRMSDLDTLRLQLLDERDHLLEMVEILSMHDQIHGESDLIAADDVGEFDLVRVCFCARYPVGRFLSGILEAELNVVEPHTDESI